MATEATTVSLPNAKQGLLLPDGTLTQPWRRFFQDMFIRSGGSSDAESIAALEAAIAAAVTLAEEGIADAAAAQSTADEALSIVGLVPLSVTQDVPEMQVDPVALLSLTTEPLVQNTQITISGDEHNTSTILISEDSQVTNNTYVFHEAPQELPNMYAIALAMSIQDSLFP